MEPVRDLLVIAYTRFVTGFNNTKTRVNGRSQIWQTTLGSSREDMYLQFAIIKGNFSSQYGVLSILDIAKPNKRVLGHSTIRSDIEIDGTSNETNDRP